MPDRTRTRSSNREARVSGIAESLTTEDIGRAAQEWRRIGRTKFLHDYGGTSAMKYVVLHEDEEIDALALLRAARRLAGLEVAPAYRGDRVNVADPLRQLGFLVENLNSDTECPVETSPESLRKWIRSFSGSTDHWSLRKMRREQRILRGALGIGTGNGSLLHQCGLCGRELPERLLVAAHIKPRNECSYAERIDIPNIGMAACTLGCDSLYEYGYITVSETGNILTCYQSGVDYEPYRARDAPAWRPDREKYFEWHRKNRFRG